MNTLVTFGDSTTAPRDGVCIYTDVLREALAMHRPAVTVINAGVPGNTTEAARLRFERDVLAHQPDMVVIQFGINDAAVDVWKDPPSAEPRVPLSRFQANLTFFVDTLLSRNCRPILMTPNPMRWTPKLRQLYGKLPYRLDEEDGLNQVLLTYAAAVRVPAERYKVDCLDIYAAFQEYNRIPGKSADTLLLDGMHPNTDGHRLVADKLLELLVL